MSSGPAARADHVAVRHRQPVSAHERLDAACRRDRLVPSRVRARLARPGASPGQRPDDLRHPAVQEPGGACRVRDAQQQQPPWPHRSGQPPEHNLGVADSVQQERAVHDVKRPGLQRDQPELAERGRAESRRGSYGRSGCRDVVVDEVYVHMVSAGGKGGKVKFSSRGSTAGLQNGDRPARPLRGVVEREPGK